MQESRPVYFRSGSRSLTAYFTDSMSDEFKKAMEEAMKDLDEESGEPKKKKTKVVRARKSRKKKTNA